MTCNILLRGVGSVASAVRSISTFISNLAQGVFIQTTNSCGSVYYKMKMEMKHQQMSQKQSSNIESQSQSKPRSETTSGMKRLQMKHPKKQTIMKMKMKMICKQEERLLRKQEFLNSKHGTHYGYSASASVSSSASSSAIEIHPIDTWRGREFPSLVEPIRTNVMIRPHMSTNSSQNKEECDARTNAETQTQTQTELELVELEREREIYLDYAGAAIPSLSLLNALHAQSKEYQIMANPHSNGPAAARTKVAIEQVKSELLQFFGATAGCKFGFSDEEDADNKNDDEEYHPGYDIVFTSGATQGLQIVAECFDWSGGHNNCGQHQHQHQHQYRDDKDDDYQDHPDHPDRMGNKSATMKANEHGSVLLYAENSHTSVLGMREPALAKGASFQCRNVDEISQAEPQDFASWACEERGTMSITLDEEETNAFVDYDRYGRNNGNAQQRMNHHQVSCVRGAPKNLLVFPLECNFDGSISSAQEIIQTSRASKSNWFSMLDIAKAAATSEINLCALDPDFACVSFYKIWGAPTGLGCLFVKRSSMNSLTTTCIRQSTCKRGGRRRYVGGGAVDICLPNQDFTRPKSSPSPLDALTSGTINFRSILSLKPGLHEVQKLGMDLVSSNQCQFLTYMYQFLNIICSADIRTHS